MGRDGFSCKFFQLSRAVVSSLLIVTKLRFELRARDEGISHTQESLKGAQPDEVAQIQAE